MKFKEYLMNAWSLHAEDPKKIADEFKSHLSLMETEDDVMAMARLIVHVCGEHLGEWEKGIALLRKIKNNATIKDKFEMNRYVAILELGNNPKLSIEHFSSSDQARIFSATSSALANLGGLKNAEKFLFHAHDLVKGKLSKEDPAIKALATAANNLASSLAEKNQLSEHEAQLMLKAAQIAKENWEVAGTWLELERAEYRLSKCFIKTNQFDLALVHAEKCLEIVNANGEAALEVFFANEVLALSLKALKNTLRFETALYNMKVSFDSLSSSEQEWCQKTLKNIDETP